MLDDSFHVYDTTLRDGAQQEGLNLTVADKLVIARQLDSLGVGFIEGGWPGAIPKDTEFFRRAATELDLKHAQLTAFGATRRAGVKAADDPQVAALRESGAPVVTLVAKSHDRHVLLALKTTLEENLEMIADTITPLRASGQRVPCATPTAACSRPSSVTWSAASRTPPRPGWGSTATMTPLAVWPTR
jgi:2-isopropylmalate synthase